MVEYRLPLSFDKIFKARLGYDLYEMNALRNDKDNVRLVLQTIQVSDDVWHCITLSPYHFLQFCDHRISRLKLEQRLRHYHLNDFRLLHLCEYFDLLLSCIPEEKPAAPPKKIVR